MVNEILPHLKIHIILNDASGNIYIADCYNHLVRKIDLSGNVTTVAGTAESEQIMLTGLASFNCPSDLKLMHLEISM